MRTSVLVLFTAASLAAVPAEAARVEIILDVSGSMRASLGAETRMDAARKAIRATLAGIQPDSVVALRLYGHRVSQDDKAASCKDTELSVPFQPVDKVAFQAIVDRATPRGQTPLTYSLEQAARDFGPASDEERVIILVSDGEESCGGDPTAAARALQAQGFKLKVHTIGFDVDVAARAQLEALSSATGGEYHDARNATALAESLTRLTQRSLLVAKGSDALGQEIRGGDGYETAVEIKPDQLYRLDHHQRKDQYDYFYVAVTGGEKVTASIETSQRGVKIRGEAFEETSDPYAGMTVQDGSRRKLGEATIFGDKAAKKSLEGSLPDAQDGRLYVLIGNQYDDQHKDARFQITLKGRPGDAGQPGDAGNAEPDAMPLATGTHRGRLDAGDKVDFYKFKADARATYRVRLRHSVQNTNLGLSVASADGDVTKSGLASDGSPATLDGIVFPRAGDVYIEVKYQFDDRPETDYTLDVVQTGGEAAATASGETAPTGATSGPSLVARFVSILLWSGVPLVLGLLMGAVGGYLLGRRRK
jgi:Ca-activated chloride channel homolog